MPIIGITGNFGMGKTTVLTMFRELGAYTFNIDKFVHEILKRPQTIKKIARALGEEVLIKRSKKISISKTRVADIIFSDSGKRKTVEEIIHPQVLKITTAAALKISKANPSALIVFEVPLLFEAGYENYFDTTIVVRCNRDVAMRRLISKGFTRDNAMKRLRAQMPITKKEKLADFVIDNNFGTNRTRKQAKRIFERIRRTRYA
jgi:dephospho-CoA kinase